MTGEKKPMVPDIPPVVQLVLDELRKDAQGKLLFPPAGAKRLQRELASLEVGAPLREALRALAGLGYLLDKECKAPAAARAMLDVAEEAAARVSGSQTPAAEAGSRKAGGSRGTR